MRKIMDNKAVSPVVGTILLIAITVALAAIVATLVSGLGGRGAPPSVMLTVKATNSGSGLAVSISHQGGDDLTLKDLKVEAINANGSEVLTVNPVEISGITTLTVGDNITITNWIPTTPATGFNAGDVITVYVIHNPSKQKLFNSSAITVQLS
jgi:flagellin-like protein